MLFGVTRFQYLAFVATAFLFIAFPYIDIWFSSLFFQNGEFYLKNSFLAKFVYVYVEKISAFIGVVVIVALIISLFRGSVFGFTKRDLVFAISAIIVAPVVFVNGILKTFIGRARPRHIDEFGGDFLFTRAFDFSANYCQTNCSFVCGHCSAGFIMIVFAFLFSGKKRLLVFVGGVIYGVVASLGRIVQGAHFLSDAVFAFIFVFLIVKIIHYIFYREQYY